MASDNKVSALGSFVYYIFSGVIELLVVSKVA
jgi:hypothetical protein